MPRTKNRNVWGSAGAGVDAQRTDLFKVTLQLPPALGGTARWTQDVEFAVEAFPFPDRNREMFAIKYMNQTNWQLGADAPLDPVSMRIRYAFNQPTLQILERWNYLTSNPETGAVAMTSAVKANGRFRWLVPNMAQQNLLENASPSEDSLVDGLVYRLEGCMVKGLKLSDADMTQSNQLVVATFTLQIDRYYPEALGAMVVTGSAGGNTGGSIQ